MKKREADFGRLFRHWLKANPLVNAAFELKQTTGNSLPFSDVQQHQIEALQAVRENGAGFLYKIPDDSMGVKPFDYAYFNNALSYIVIKYPDHFCLIEPDDFILERDVLSNRKSLTSARAKAIAVISVDL